MSAPRLPSWLRPSREHELLLKAALLRGGVALEAWRDWLGRVDLETVDSDSLGLVPLLYFNLRRQAVTAPQIGLYQGAFRKAWYRNTLLLHRLAALLRGLAEAGVQGLLLDDLPLAVLDYPTLAARPVAQLDVLLRPVQVFQALKRVRELEWEILSPLSPAALVAVSHEITLKDSSGHLCRLHWGTLAGQGDGAREEAVWSDARPLRLAGSDALALNRVDQLLRVCVDGLAGDESRALWVADAVMILNAASDLDWSRLMARVERPNVASRLARSLPFLAETFEVRVPPSVRDGLGVLRAPDARLVRSDLVPAKTWGPAKALRLRWQEYLRFIPAGTSSTARGFGFLRYLQAQHQLSHLWLVPVVVPYRALRKTAHARGRGLAEDGSGADWPRERGLAPEIGVSGPDAE